MLFRAAQVKSDCPGMPDRLQSGTWVPVIEWVQYKKWVTMVLEDQKSQKVTEATLWERVAKVKLQDTLVKIGEMDFIWIAALEAQASGQDCARLCCNKAGRFLSAKASGKVVENIKAEGDQSLSWGCGCLLRIAFKLGSHPATETWRQWCDPPWYFHHEGWLPGLGERHSWIINLAKGWQKIYISKGRKRIYKCKVSKEHTTEKGGPRSVVRKKPV